MSELKATTAQEIVQNEKDCDYMDELFGGVKMPPTQVYLKSEADKVIAHNKYKRCLAMAKWCHTNDQMMSRLYKEACIVKIQGRDSYFFQARWWEKWRKRWLELAEEPTWAEFLQLIHNEASK